MSTPIRRIPRFIVDCLVLLWDGAALREASAAAWDSIKYGSPVSDTDNV